MYLAPHNQYRAPSVEELADWLADEHGDHSDRLASRLRDLWRVRTPEALPKHVFDAFVRHHPMPHSVNVDDVKRWYIDRAARSTHGVQLLGQTRKGVDVHHCNAGGPYAPTICFVGGTMKIATCADIANRRGFKSA